MSEDDKPLRGYERQSAATGLSIYQLEAIRIASRGKPDCPFRGQFATARALLKWVEAHVEFVASHYRAAPAERLARGDSSPSPDATAAPMPAPVDRSGARRVNCAPPAASQTIQERRRAARERCLSPA
jgi:hypothetical protein